ncbi:hypothetical protein ENUP19_0114G0017 [Entamoeba nuttalli]|uniref:Uncharacterized protein n=1 Tax=Entamoeba nuttalli TaxID=412467 RepID=A0ABQ0DI64_9EUKA
MTEVKQKYCFKEISKLIEEIAEDEVVNISMYFVESYPDEDFDNCRSENEIAMKRIRYEPSVSYTECKFINSKIENNTSKKQQFTNSSKEELQELVEKSGNTSFDKLLIDLILSISNIFKNK